MRIFTFTFVMLVVCLSTFAQSSNTCPSYFRRNNGNGTCPDGQLKLYFTDCPTVASAIDSVYTDGVKRQVTFYAPDISKCQSQGYIGYCVSGGNMPPSANWVIYFHNALNISTGCNVSEGATLPVKYFSFDALTADKTVTLNWVTEVEINNSHFEVERSLDGTNFKQIGLVLEGFVNGTKKSYQFKDNAVELQSNPVVYYRLKQIDNNGMFTYSNTLVVKLQSKAGVVMQTSPNPFTDILNVSFTASETAAAQINIINITGQKIFTKQLLAGKGYNTLQLNVNDLPKLAPGIYVAQLVINGSVTSSQKIIKK